jgi:hypothetical protein
MRCDAMGLLLSVSLMAVSCDSVELEPPNDESSSSIQSALEATDGSAMEGGDHRARWRDGDLGEMAESIILQESSLDRLEAWRITRVVDGASESLAFGDLRLLAAGPMEVNDIERSVIGGFSMGPEVGLEVTAEYYGWTNREPYEPPTEEEELNGHEPEPQPSGPLVDPELLALVAAGSTERVESVLSYDIGDEHLPLLRGEGEDALRFVEMNEDEQDAFRVQQWGVRSARLRELAEPLLQFAESVDVEVIWLGELAPVMHLGGSPTTVLRVAEHEMVLRTDLNREGQTFLEDGSDVVRGMQVLQFHDISLQGGYSSNLARTIRIGVVDKWFNIDHVAFNNNSYGSSRVFGAYNCDSAPCAVGVPTPGIGDNAHGSRVAAAATADLSDGQDSTIAAYTQAAAARSGISPESRLFVADSRTVAGIPRGIERMVLSGVNILTNAYGDADFMSCANNLHATAIEVNAAFENGITLVFPAGNAGHVTGACNGNYGGDCGHLCTLQPGASATGSLAVNAIETDGNDDHTDYWTSGTYPLSGNGGDGNNYWEPTRVDVVAPLGRTFLVHDLSDTGIAGGYYDYFRGGTSYSAPIVAGALAVWTEFAADHWSSAAVSPGINYATSLVFSDGYIDASLSSNDVASANPNALSNVTGAGRFRARLPTGAGLDSPWAYAWSSFPMTSYDTEDILANGGAPLNADINRYRHAFWNYESNDPAKPAFVWMYVKSVAPGNSHGWTADTNGTQYSVSSPDRRDWKGRIDLTETQIDDRRIYTQFITNDLPNETSRVVHYVRYLEDLDRDDTDGPASEIQ